MAFGPNVKQEHDDGLEEEDERYDNILEAFGGDENGEARESNAAKENFKRPMIQDNMRCVPCNTVFKTHHSKVRHLRSEGHKILVNDPKPPPKQNTQVDEERNEDGEIQPNEPDDRDRIPEALKCDPCNVKFKRKDAKVRHVKGINHIKIVSGEAVAKSKIAAEERSLDCDKCGKTFRRFDSKKRHVQKEVCTNPFPYSAKVVRIANGEQDDDGGDKRMVFKLEVNEALKVPAQNILTCPTCGFVTITQQEYTRHVSNTHTYKRVFTKVKCQHCDFATKRRKLLRLHMKAKHPEKVVDNGEDEMVSSKSMDKLYKSVTENRNISKVGMMLKCDECDFLCKYTHSLESHIRRIHPAGAAMCEDCGNEFKNEQTLKRHKEQTHIDPDAYKCELCPWATGRKWELPRHMKLIHEGGMKYRCSYDGCNFGARYKKKWLLKHLGEKHQHKFTCDEINITFMFPHKKYRIVECPFFCTNYIDFKKHVINTHSYRCEYCSENIQPQFHKTHVRAYHPEEAAAEAMRPKDINEEALKRIDQATGNRVPPRKDSLTYYEEHRCETCDITYSCRKNLRRHMKTDRHIKGKESSSGNMNLQKEGAQKENEENKDDNDEDNEKFSCPECEYKAGRLKYLRNHLALLHGVELPRNGQQALIAINHPIKIPVNNVQRVNNFHRKATVPKPNDARSIPNGQENEMLPIDIDTANMDSIGMAVNQSLLHIDDMIYNDIDRPLTYIPMADELAEQLDSVKNEREELPFIKVEPEAMSICRICNKSFASPELLKRHQLTAHVIMAPKPQKPKVTQKPMFKSDPVKREQDIITCDYCPFRTIFQADYETHKVHHEDLMAPVTPDEVAEIPVNTGLPIKTEKVEHNYNDNEEYDIGSEEYFNMGLSLMSNNNERETEDYIAESESYNMDSIDYDAENIKVEPDEQESIEYYKSMQRQMNKDGSQDEGSESESENKEEPEPEEPKEEEYEDDVGSDDESRTARRRDSYDDEKEEENSEDEKDEMVIPKKEPGEMKPVPPKPAPPKPVSPKPVAPAPPKPVTSDTLHKNAPKPVAKIMAPPNPNANKNTCRYCSREFTKIHTRIRHEQQVHMFTLGQEHKIPKRRDALTGDDRAMLPRQRDRQGRLKREPEDLDPTDPEQLAKMFKEIQKRKPAVKNNYCDKCDEKFRDNRSYLRHNKYIHNILPEEEEKKTRDFLCHLCSFTAYIKSKLERHVRVVHEKERNFLCDMCEHRAASNNNLDRHKYVMHVKNEKRRNYEQEHGKQLWEVERGCPECDFKTYEKASMKEHIEDKHNVVADDRMLEEDTSISGGGRSRGVIRCCQRCDFTTEYLRTIKSHLKIKHGLIADDKMLQDSIVKGGTEVKPIRRLKKTPPEFLLLIERVSDDKHHKHKEIKKSWSRCRECSKEGRFDNLMRHVQGAHRDALNRAIEKEVQKKATEERDKGMKQVTKIESKANADDTSTKEPPNSTQNPTNTNASTLTNQQ